MKSSHRRSLRVVALSAASLLLLAVGVVTATEASADTAPISGLPATVSADALPTVQVNGVVWSQVTVGNTVYATGSFTSARPAGSAAGVNETPRKNLLAYDITTGNLITTFNHSLNAQGEVISKSPDGSVIYVGGDFTSVDGVSHNRIVAISTVTGAVVQSFAPSFNARVHAIAATSSTVYVGGSFTAVGAINRSRLAAVAVGNGALTTWAPAASDQVDAMVFSPAGKVIVGGRFQSLNTTTAFGLGALDPTSGATLPWAVNQKVQDSGANAGITSLSTDGSQVYGTGFVFGAGGNLEGTFAANPETGAINWIEDCHGDTYSSFPMGQSLYVVSHEHDCSNIGAWPPTNPLTYYRATAFTTYPTGTIAHNSVGTYPDWFGNPAPTQLDWYPTLAIGTYTGQHQAAWSVTGTSQYISLGGEFPTVNGTAQQGLTRFANRSIAPNKVGPRPAAGLTPTLSTPSAGTVNLTWNATFDQDNQALTYKVVRDGNVAAPVFTTTVNSTFWQLPSLSFSDKGVAGGTHSYRIYVTDPFANQMTGSSVSIAVTGGAIPNTASDTFNRTVTIGLGTADSGGAWTTVGAAANLSVAPGAASLAMPAAAQQASAYLPAVTSTSSETDVTITTDKVPSSSGVFFYLTGRRVSTNNEYRGRVRIAGSSVYVSLYKLAGSSTATLIGSEAVVPGLTYTAGLQLVVKLQVQGTGTTNLRLKVWNAATAEPAAWNVTNTDTTAGLQAAGSPGLTSYLSGSATNAPIVLKVSQFAFLAI